MHGRNRFSSRNHFLHKTVRAYRDFPSDVNHQPYYSAHGGRLMLAYACGWLQSLAPITFQNQPGPIRWQGLIPMLWHL
jgi:hypothetical protein